MTQAFSRIEASKSAASARVADAFKNEDGAFDLPSILVGVVVVGVLTAGVLASIFGVIPFAQDKGAQQDLGAIATAEGVYKAKGTSTLAPGASYGADIAALQGEKLIGSDVKVGVSGDAGSWSAATKSGSGKTWVASSTNSTPVEYTASYILTATQQVKDAVAAIPAP